MPFSPATGSIVVNANTFSEGGYFDVPDGTSTLRVTASELGATPYASTEWLVGWPDVGDTAEIVYGGVTYTFEAVATNGGEPGTPGNIGVWRGVNSAAANANLAAAMVAQGIPISHSSPGNDSVFTMDTPGAIAELIALTPEQRGFAYTAASIDHTAGRDVFRFSGRATADIAADIAGIINASASLGVTATVDGSTVTLTNDQYGSAGNQPISSNNVGAELSVSGMSGGTNVSKIKYKQLNLAGAIVSGDLAADAVETAAILDGNVTTAKLAADAVNGDKIADDAIGSEHLADGAVGTDALGADAVNGDKLADDAVGSEHLADGSVGTDALADGGVTNAKLAGSIAVSKLAAADAALDMNSQRITNLGTATSASDAVSKGYVDSLVQGLSPKEAVRAASTAAVTLASDVEDGDTLDGVTLATGDRVLLKDQADASENGIYIVAASGAPSRASDADSQGDLEGMFCIVMEGTANADSAFILSTDDFTGGIGTADLTFVPFSGVSGIADGSITTAKLANDAVTNAKLADDAVETANIVDGNVTTAKLAADAVNGDKIADDAIGSEHIADGAINDSAMIQSGAITSSNLGGGTVIGANIAGDAIDGSKIADDAVDTEHLADGAVETAALGADAVTNAKLADDAVETANIVDANVTTAKLANTAVTTGKIADDAVTAAKIVAGIVSVGIASGDGGDSERAASASGTISGSNQATNVDIAAAPMGRVLASINGSLEEIGLSDSDALYFRDAGDSATRSAWSQVQATDVLYVNTAALGYTLDTSDLVTLIYDAQNG